MEESAAIETTLDCSCKYEVWTDVAWFDWSLPVLTCLFDDTHLLYFVRVHLWVKEKKSHFTSCQIWMGVRTTRRTWNVKLTAECAGVMMRLYAQIPAVCISIAEVFSFPEHVCVSNVKHSHLCTLQPRWQLVCGTASIINTTCCFLQFRFVCLNYFCFIR